MKRFDRAMYAFFLLALLADVARSHALITSGDDSSGGLILSVVSQLSVAQTGAPDLASGAQKSSLPQRVRLAGYRWTLPRWARVLCSEAKPSRHLISSTPVLLSAVVLSPEGDPSPAEITHSGTAPQSSTVFEHIGSPAP